jgi:hypothetical protein
MIRRSPDDELAWLLSTAALLFLAAIVLGMVLAFESD